MNRVLSDGGEHNFTATAAEFVRQESWGTASSAYGACDLGHPRQYRFEYLYDSNSFDIDFVNTAEATVRDDDGNLFYHTALSVPIQLSKPQGVVLQLSIEPSSDRGADAVIPAFVYSLVRGTDFLATPPFYRNLAVGVPLDDHSYEFQLRIPKEVATDANIVMIGGVPMATLILMPMWLSSGPSAVTRSALDATSITVGAAISRVRESAELVVARLATDMEALQASLPTSVEGYATGYFSFGGYSVYLYRLGDTNLTQGHLRQLTQSISLVNRRNRLRPSNRPSFGIQMGLGLGSPKMALDCSSGLSRSFVAAFRSRVRLSGRCWFRS